MGCEEKKMPQAGEWWEKTETGQRIHCIGKAASGRCVLEFNDRSISSRSTCFDFTRWRRLDGCDSFEWVSPPEPETFPQWWTTTDDPHHPIAFVRRDSATTMTLCRKDGSECKGYAWEFHDGNRERLTESEALALLNPPVPKIFPQWICRKAIDGSKIAFIRRESADVYAVVYLDGSELIHTDGFSAIGRTSMSKADALALLDPPAKKTKTVTITRWLCSDDGESWVLIFCIAPPTAWKTVIAQGTETFEVPE